MIFQEKTIYNLHPGIYNPGQNIWNKIETSSKNEPGKKSFIPTFACFLTAITKVNFLKEN